MWKINMEKQISTSKKGRTNIVDTIIKITCPALAGLFMGFLVTKGIQDINNMNLGYRIEIPKEISGYRKKPHTPSYREIIDLDNDGHPEKVFENITPWRDVRMGIYRKPSQQEINWYEEHYKSLWGKRK